MGCSAYEMVGGPADGRLVSNVTAAHNVRAYTVSDGTLVHLYLLDTDKLVYAGFEVNFERDLAPHLVRVLGGPTDG